MANYYVYGALASPSAGDQVRQRFGVGDYALIGGFTRASGTVAIDGSGAISATSPANQDFTVNTSGSGTVDINAGSGGLDVDSTGDIAFTTSGTANISGYATGRITLESVDISSFQVNGNSSSDRQLTLTADNSGSGNGIVAIAATAGAGSGTILVTADNEIDLNAPLIDVGGTSLDVDMTGAATIDAVGDSNFTTTYDSANIEAKFYTQFAATYYQAIVGVEKTGGTANIAAALVATDTTGSGAAGVTLDAYGAAANNITIGSTPSASTADIWIGTAGGATGTRDINIGSSAETAEVDITASDLDFNAGDDIFIDAGGRIRLDGNDHSLFTVTSVGMTLTLSATGGGNTQKVIINTDGTSTSAIDIAASSGGVEITSSLNIILDSNAGYITFDDVARAASSYSIPMQLGSAAAEYTLFDTNFGEVSIINAINQNAAAIAAEDLWNKAGIILSPTTATNTVSVAVGTAALPAYSFTADPNTGIWRTTVSGADALGFSTAGATQVTVSARGLLSTASGSAGAPAYSFSSDDNTGIYRTTDYNGNDAVAFTAGGSLAGITSSIGVGCAASGSAANPAIYRTGDADVGLYWGSFGSQPGIGVSTAGTVRLDVSSAVFGVQDVGSISMTSTGGATLTSAGAMALTYDSDTSGDAATIKRGANTLATFGTAGSVAFTPQTTQTFSVLTDGSGGHITLTADDGNITNTYDSGFYITESDGNFTILSGSTNGDLTLQDNVHIPRNASELQTLLTANFPATIILKPNTTYNITGGGAVTVDYPKTIIGQLPVGGASATILTMAANTYLSITAPCVFENVTFTDSYGASRPTYSIQMSSTGDYTRFSSCVFDVTPSTASIAVNNNCQGVTIENSLFTDDPGTGTNTSLIYLGDCHYTTIRGNKATGIGCDWAVYHVASTGSLEYTIIDGNTFISAAGGGCGVFLGDDSWWNKIINNTFNHDDGAVSTILYLTFGGNYNIIAQNVFNCMRTSWSSSSVHLIDCGQSVTSITDNVFQCEDIGYTATNNNISALINVGEDASYCTITGNNMTAMDCRCGIFISGTNNAGSSPTTWLPMRCVISNNFIRGIGCSDGGGSYPSYGICIGDPRYTYSSVYPPGWHTIVGNNISGGSGNSYFGIWGPTSTTRQSRYNNIIGNHVGGFTSGINAAGFDYSAIMGNGDTSTTIGSSISGTNTTNQWGTTNTTAPGANH